MLSCFTPSPAMASSTHGIDLFEADAVSSSISPEESVEFFKIHGFFYQADREIGELVDRLYSEGRARSENSLNHFKRRLLEVPVCVLQHARA